MLTHKALGTFGPPSDGGHSPDPVPARLECTRRPPHGGVVPLACGALALIGALTLTSCDSILDTRSAPPPSAAMAVSLQVGSGLGGDAQAFDKADAAHIELRRQSDDSTEYDQTINLAKAGGNRQTAIQLDLKQEVEAFDLTVELLDGGQSLFAGTTPVSLRRGQVTSVDMSLDPIVASLRITPATVTLTALGDTADLEVAALFSTGDVVGGVLPELTTQDAAVASVSGTTVMAVGEGATSVVARSGTVSASVPVRVQPTIAVVSVSPASDTLVVGEQIQLSATARDANGHPLAGTATWTSSDSSVVSVDASGMLHGLSAGQATVTATVQGVGGQASITVAAGPAPNLVAGAPIVTPADPTTAETVSIQAPITNTGNAGSGTFAWRLQVDTTTVASGETSLAAGGQRTVQADAVGPLAAGTHTATLEVDYTGAMSELNEGNNTNSTQFQVTAAQEASLTVGVLGLGTVASSGATPAIECRTETCSESYPIGAQVTLTATPDSAYVFESWFGTGGGFACTTSPTCAVTMDQDRTVTARFVAPGAVKAEPDRATFTMIEGEAPTPSPHTIKVLDVGGQAVDVSVSTSYSPSVTPWLSATLDRTVIDTLDPATLTLSVIPDSLEPGTYAAAVSVGNGSIADTVDVMLTVVPRSPVISDLSGRLVELNDSVGCAKQKPHGSLYAFRFGYTDADGDVTRLGSALTVDYLFDTGASGQFSQPPEPGLDVDGDGSSGTGTSYVCVLFGDAGSVSQTFTLRDAAGRPSNPLSITVQRPEGTKILPHAGNVTGGRPSRNRNDRSP